MFLNFLFICATLLTVISALALVITRNLIHSCVFLLGTLLGVAGLYATLGADFVAAAQIMVYVGGVVILMLFGMMLTGGKDFVSKAQSLLGLAPAMGNKFTYAIGILTALVFIFANVAILDSIISTPSKNEQMSFVSTVSELGYLLVTDHLLAFEISSVLLLGALIGAAIIARPRKEEN